MTAKEMIIDHLLDLDVCIESEPEYTVRCPYCGDSDNPNHAHLGICVDVDTDDPILWNCLKCGECGILTEKLLDDLGITLSASDYKLFKDYEKRLKRTANSKQNIIKTARYKCPPEVSNSRYLRKLQYVIERIGTNIQSFAQNKIILSLFDFMQFNEIDSLPGVAPWKMKALDQCYVGFLSSNNNCITFRRIVNDQNLRRYEKVILNPYMDSPGSFYSIPTQLDLMYHEPLHVHIAEGPFDILSIRYNLYGTLDRDPERRLFYANCGFSYLNILKFLIRNGICNDLTLHIYADRDKTDTEHRRILKKSPVTTFFDHVYLHRNMCPGEKDYGVPMESIRDQCRKLW